MALAVQCTRTKTLSIAKGRNADKLSPVVVPRLRATVGAVRASSALGFVGTRPSRCHRLVCRGLLSKLMSPKQGEVSKPAFDQNVAIIGLLLAFLAVVLALIPIFEAKLDAQTKDIKEELMEIKEQMKEELMEIKEQMKNLPQAVLQASESAARQETRQELKAIVDAAQLVSKK